MIKYPLEVLKTMFLTNHLPIVPPWQALGAFQDLYTLNSIFDDARLGQIIFTSIEWRMLVFVGCPEELSLVQAPLRSGPLLNIWVVWISHADNSQ